MSTDDKRPPDPVITSTAVPYSEEDLRELARLIRQAHARAQARKDKR